MGISHSFFLIYIYNCMHDTWAFSGTLTRSLTGSRAELKPALQQNMSGWWFSFSFLQQHISHSIACYLTSWHCKFLFLLLLILFCGFSFKGIYSNYWRLSYTAVRIQFNLYLYFQIKDELPMKLLNILINRMQDYHCPCL